MTSMLYLDHNSTTPIHPRVMDSVRDIIDKPLNPSSVHAYGRRAKAIIEDTRIQVARIAGIYDKYDKYQITFTSSGTEANNLIISNFVNNQIAISSTEHSSIYKYAELFPHIKRVKVDSNGLLDMDSLESALAKMKQKVTSVHNTNNHCTNINISNQINAINTHHVDNMEDIKCSGLLSVHLANNETGVIQNLKKIVDVAHSYNVLVHTDAVQAFGKIKVDLLDADVDFATISSHKIGGMHGAAALIAKKKYTIKPIILGGGQELSRRSGTENVIAIATFGKAIDIAIDEIDIRYDKMIKLRNKLESKLSSHMTNIIIAGYEADRLPNTTAIINLTKASDAQIIALDIQNIYVSNGSACSSGAVKPSHAITAMGYSEKNARSLIRVSTSFDTSADDIDKFIHAYLKINVVS